LRLHRLIGDHHGQHQRAALAAISYWRDEAGDGGATIVGVLMPPLEQKFNPRTGPRSACRRRSGRRDDGYFRRRRQAAAIVLLKKSPWNRNARRPQLFITVTYSPQ